MAKSKLVIIDESTPVPDHPGKGRGLDLSARPRGRAYEGVAEPFPAELLIPRSDWQGMIQEQEEQKSRIIDICDRAGVEVEDQEQTNFCWANAPVHATRVVRAIQNEPMVKLSPASVAAQITGFKNEGGWGLDALKFIVANGVVPADKWPANAINRKYATPENKALALHYRVDEWMELKVRSLDEMVSCVLRRIPVAIGLNWWGHEVTATFLKWMDGTVATGIDNSWGLGYGDRGRAVLQGNRMLPDDAVAPRTVYSS